jgi:MoxR-like ATPase
MTKSKPLIFPYTGEALIDGASTKRRYYDFSFDQTDFKEIAGKDVMVINEKGENAVALETIDPYHPDEMLRETVELMQILERPLLLRGEPGCGKTRVAQAYAFERYKNEPEGYRRYYYEWHIKSTSKAQDGLYHFDHIARLRDANKGGNGKGNETGADLTRYRELGPLGKAFLASEPDKPAILLIDEIDKADIDFPNDLLLELDEMRFSIRETGEEIVPRCRPLIFITSNQERELPQAFLRRCLFHYIQFPGKSLLQEIMLANFPQFKKKLNGEGGDYISNAIDRFIGLREQLKANPTANKNVSTGELKDWMRLLVHYFEKDSTDKKIDVLGEHLPFHTALLKTENDLKSVGKFEKVNAPVTTK